MTFHQRAVFAGAAGPAARIARWFARWFARCAPLRHLIALPLPLALLLVWWTGYRAAWISPQVLPSIGQVVHALGAGWQSGDLQRDAGVSLLRVLAGFVLGGTLGVPLGVAMGLSERIRDYVYPCFRIIAYVPLLGWLPLLVLVLGIGETLKIVLIAKAALVPITLNTYNGMRNVPAAYGELGAVFRFSRWQLIRHVVFPAAFPQIWSGVRYGLTQCWLLLVIVEFLASDSGLGYMIISGQQLFQMDTVFAALLVIGVIGFLLDRGLRWLEACLFGEERRP
ncbi:binding--dependent transport system inner membrane component family protein [Paraburkholderia xenovorans LB400]|uniref:ABC sulfate ester transporter, inner membrane subunit n=1 Tax=Paraburkholderia xenovorans (strain LB400) TaxID=266265 RepID=Q13IC9_PARXL|nr:ABC transporter permease [Paraburkholderia xenovorans]ABE36160.1 ABC sulfate ester transporter, inner membrane subunit [Paraburkholderia xenovorans LB400]AIP34237.1 binding--dependent transport system inner membrane component family protein [Paraburkholderia xenovorans LB400]